MASETTFNNNLKTAAVPQTDFSIGDAIRLVLAPLASLKLTVVLFAMAIFIVLAGTMAQVDKDIWQVIDEYFRVPVLPTLGFAWIDFQIFFPKSFFPPSETFPNGIRVPGGIYFPGGWLIGAAMLMNLLAAHAVRFTVQARGTRLALGLVVLLVGALMTWLVIASGSNKDGVQEAIWSDWSKLWLIFKIGLGVLWIVALYATGAAVLKKMNGAVDPPSSMVWLLAAFSAVMTAVVGWILIQGSASQLNDSSMRILWQLVKAEFAAGVLLAGCIMLFKKRAGVVLLHAGVILMMFSEFLVGVTAVEQQISLREGQVVNYARDVRQYEVAVVDPSGKDKDFVVTIPQSLFPPESTPNEKFESDFVISDPKLPFDVKLITFFRNSNLREAGEQDKDQALLELPRVKLAAEPADPVSGTDMNEEIDIPSVAAEFIDKETNKVLCTKLLNLGFNELRDLPAKVTVDEKTTETVDGKSVEKVTAKTYDVALRFKRTYKPYSVRLIDVRKDDYMGTSTVKNYSSEIKLVDGSRNTEFNRNIWMNNPLRYAGETFYQSNYGFDPESKTEQTTLQVVTNTGWMIPYVSCMIVATGMLSHFWLTLLRFLGRGTSPAPAKVRTAVDRKRAVPLAPNFERNDSVSAIIVPLIVCLIVVAWLGSKAYVRSPKPGAMDLYSAGKIPIMYEGRFKPLDTLARNSLQVVSSRQTFVDEEGKKQPAIKWLLDVIADPKAADQHKVFRIDHPEVLKFLRLEPREGYRYSVAELRPRIKEFEDEAKSIAGLNRKELNTYQRKVLDLDRKLRGTYASLMASFRAPKLPDLPKREDLVNNRQEANATMAEIEFILTQTTKDLQAVGSPPLAVPLSNSQDDGKDAQWEPYSAARLKADLVQKLRAQAPGMTELGEPEPAAVALHDIFSAYGKGDADTFNSATESYLKSLKDSTPAGLSLSKTNFEAYFNYIEAFFYPVFLTIGAFVLSLAALMGWRVPLNRTAFWLIVITLVVHTFALVARMYLTDRWMVMVTNLYSSAVFIGWADMVVGLVLEAVYKLGFGNIIAAVAGFATLLIAHFLSLDGDTLIVMQAVLDTNFWLATHVTCVTLGYAMTFVAGLIGILYILLGFCTPIMNGYFAKSLIRMTYGTLCFALFFSLIRRLLFI